MLEKMKKWLANKILGDLWAIGLILLPLIFKAEESGGTGPEKKQKVIDEVMAVLNQPGGIDAPGWVLGILQSVVLPWLIDIIVGVMNSEMGKN